MKLSDTPVTQHQVASIPFFLKRDDQLHSHFSGNKARKLMSVLSGEWPKVKTLIGYGSAQANSAYSLAALAAIKGWAFEFYVDRIPAWLEQQPMGNYRGVLELGGQIIAVGDSGLEPARYIEQIRQPDDTCLVIPEGGHSTLAEPGVAGLAREILSWTRYHPEHEFVVALPSGTGTTSLYLQKALRPHGIEVLTCPCVGGRAYLEAQWRALGEEVFPTVLELEQKHHFGKLYQADYRMWQQLLADTDVEFDLLYDPMMWRCLLNWYPNHPQKTILYVHQGGLLGNESMLARYQRKFDGV
ncbi:pyridoxal-phosphate dependent enzyme [Vibrio cholerae]